jgi:(p)ppGpp synthase/HD superfamily hydrolase
MNITENPMIDMGLVSDLISRARHHATYCVESTNHRYDCFSYMYHLENVARIASEFIYLNPPDQHENILAACWLHDSIEDHRQTYNDILHITNREVAEIVFALTNNKGRTRKERADRFYYHGIRAIPGAVFVKLCDRVANVLYSKRTNSEMFHKYKHEHSLFIDELRSAQHAPLIHFLDKLVYTVHEGITS